MTSSFLIDNMLGIVISSLQQRQYAAPATKTQQIHLTISDSILSTTMSRLIHIARIDACASAVRRNAAPALACALARLLAVALGWVGSKGMSVTSDIAQQMNSLTFETPDYVHSVYASISAFRGSLSM